MTQQEEMGQLSPEQEFDKIAELNETIKQLKAEQERLRYGHWQMSLRLKELVGSVAGTLGEGPEICQLCWTRCHELYAVEAECCINCIEAKHDVPSPDEVAMHYA